MRGEIPDQFLDTTIAIYRKTGALDDIGDLTMSSSTAYASIPANIQPDDSGIEIELQGVVHVQTHLCFINRYENSIKKVIRTNDVIMDIEKGHKYLILSILDFTTGSKQIDRGGYFELGLKHLDDARYEEILRKTTTVGAYIT